MVHRERRGRLRPAADSDVHVPWRVGAATPAEAVLALQAGAGNQAVTRALQRFYERPGATRNESPKNAKGKLKEGWAQNGRPPVDRILLQEGSQWYIWSQNKREWQTTEAPEGTAATEATTGATAEVEEEAATPPVKVPAPPRRYPLPANAPIQSLEGHSGLSLPASKESPVELPGGSLPDKFVEMLFGYLDTPALLALRTASPWLLEHGSTALREHLHKRTEQHPKGRVGETLGSMSSLGAKPLVEQYRDAIKERPPEQLVVASDKVNASTIATLTSGLGSAVSVYYGERTDRGRADPRFTQVPGPYDEGTHGGVKHSKMHNKLVVGGHIEEPPVTVPAPDESPATERPPAWKGEFLLSGSPNLTASAMQANIESAVLIRYPGIAKLYKDYVERVTERKTDDPEFTNALKSFNERNVVGIRAALAPFVDIGETLNAELQGADQITMRMYLVGSGEKHDTVGTLCHLADSGAEVNVVVDAKEASHTAYVREALRRLQDSGVNVASELGKEKDPRRLAPHEDPRGIMHDKVILAHYPGSDTVAERWTVMIGSSGLTRNVDQNWNYENLLIIDDKTLFDSLMVHHDEAEDYRTPGIPRLEAGSALETACTLLEQHVYRPDGTWDWAPVGRVVGGRPRWMHRDVVFDAARELGMVVEKYGGQDWFGFR